jgi:hypothetical protein
MGEGANRARKKAMGGDASRGGGHGDWAKEEERGRLDISNGTNLVKGKISKTKVKRGKK